MKIYLTHLLLSLSIIIGLTLPTTPTTHAQGQPLDLPPGFIQEVLAKDLGPATAFAITPTGHILIARKHGSVKVYRDGQVLEAPFIDISGQINNYADRGLIGMALHPNFPNPAYVYLAFAYNPTGSAGHDPGGARVGRVLRVQADPANLDKHLPGSDVVILGVNGTFETMGNPDHGDRAPFGCMNADGTHVRDCLPLDGATHTVDGLAFGPDGALYVSTGDGTLNAEASIRAIDIDSLSGKILRINPISGEGYASNPFFDGDPGSNRSKVYAMGLRNPFRFSFEPGSGRVFVGDVGGEQWEEINRGFPGANFGWPCFEGVIRLSAHPACGPLIRGERPVTHAIYAYPHENAYGAAIGGDFYTHMQFPPPYRGAYFFADHNRAVIQSMTFGSGGVTVRQFAGNAISPVQLTVGNDGALYVLSFVGGTLTRIRYEGGGNTPPLANIAATPTSGLEPLSVTFSSNGSIDPDGAALHYEWAFGDGGTSNEANPRHTYIDAGQYQATLTVTDDAGATAQTTIQIYVGGNAPTVRIVQPKDESSWQAGDTLSLLAEATDIEDGPLRGAEITWDATLHHNDHVHLDAFHATGAAPTMIFEPHGINTYIELCVTATDADGLQGRACVDLRQKADPRLQLDLTADGHPSSAPPSTSVDANDTTAASSGATGRILREIWWGLGGATVGDLTAHPRFRAGPDDIEYLSALESSSMGKDYGERLRGYLYPPVDGDYRFWIASDDSSELWLSTDDNPQNKRYLAGVNGWTPRLAWDQQEGQASVAIPLEQGKRYYIEVLHKQADQKDNLSVAWQIPGRERVVIDGGYLSPVGTP